MGKEILKVVAGSPDSPLVIGGIEIQCYVLEDETRVLSQRGVIGALGMARGSTTGRNSRNGGDRLANFVWGNAIAPHVTGITLVESNWPVRFRPPHGGRIAYGYPAVILAEVCESVLSARAAGDLTKQQLHIAERCEILMRGFARVGIISLVDEATGYQEVRDKLALAMILEKFIDETLQPWTKTFPDDFYEEIFRLNDWGAFDRSNCPSVVGHYTNNIVYERLAPGVLRELRRKNPLSPEGYRKNKHHQWLTRDHGQPKLREHLIGVTAIMRTHTYWDDFVKSLSRAYPKQNEQISMHLGQYSE